MFHLMFEQNVATNLVTLHEQNVQNGTKAFYAQKEFGH
jgi:hypothetical protein